MTKKSAIALCASLLLAGPVQSAWAPPITDLVVTPRLSPPEGGIGNNLSAEFQAMMESASPSESLFEALRSFKILIVPGFKNDAMGRSSGDFADQVSVLTSGGLSEGEDFHVLNSRDGFGGLKEMAQNSKAIAGAIIGSKRPVILISQSKGSADVLDALLNYPQVQSQVHAWFSIQGAIWGSQIADGIEAKPKARFFFHRAMRLLGGSSQTIVELQKSERRKYMRAHLAAIAHLNKNLRVISWASYKSPEAVWWPLQKLAAGYFPEVKSVMSDGVIQLQDALVPQSSYIVVNNVDHADSTLQSVDKDRKKTDPPGFNRRQFMIAMAMLTVP